VPGKVYLANAFRHAGMYKVFIEYRVWEIDGFVWWNVLRSCGLEVKPSVHWNAFVSLDRHTYSFHGMGNKWLLKVFLDVSRRMLAGRVPSPP
jgi:hypothetical protein